MKRIIAAILLIFISVGGSILVSVNVQKKSDIMIDLMKNDREIIISSKATDFNRTQKIEEQWKGMEDFMAAFLPHSEIDAVEIGIKCLVDYNNQGLTDEYLETLNECINTLNHVKETEKIYFKNIF